MTTVKQIVTRSQRIYSSAEELLRARQYLQRYSASISSNNDYRGHTKIIDQINIGTTRRVRQAPRKLPFAHREEAHREIQNTLKAGEITPSSSPWCSLVVLERKRDGKFGKLRYCINFRQLNNTTLKNIYPLPSIDAVLDSLSESTFFTALDWQTGYWQCEVAPSGVCNGPAIFQRLMDVVLHGLEWKSALVYLNDVIVFGTSFEEHLEKLAAVLDKL